MKGGWRVRVDSFSNKKAKGLKHGKGKYSPNVSTLIKHFLACHCSRPMTIDQLCSAEDIMQVMIGGMHTLEDSKIKLLRCELLTNKKCYQSLSRGDSHQPKRRD